jgi:hypothetical protein
MFATPDGVHDYTESALQQCMPTRRDMQPLQMCRKAISMVRHGMMMLRDQNVNGGEQE